MWRVTACATLLGCTAIVSSCTTSSISTSGASPSFSSTSALDSVSDNDRTALTSDADIDKDDAIDQALADASPATAPRAVAPENTQQADKAPANVASFTDDQMTTQTIAAKPPVEPLTPADVITTTEPATASATPTSTTLPTEEPAANAESVAQPTGVFAFLKRNNDKRLEDEAANKAEAKAKRAAAKKAVDAKSTRLAASGASATRKKQVTEMRALPGVRANSLFGISKAEADVEKPVQLASASIGAGTRGAKNGIATQTPNVNVGCFRPELVKAIKKIERHYGKKVVVTSGYRSPKKNRRAGGSKKSLHMYCAAADVQVDGVSKWALAKYIRSMPGRGGVGTYCHTKSVHIDIGSKRDWNWRCRRK